MSWTTFFHEWISEIIAILVWTLALWLLSFLPDKYKLHKRLAFALKVREAMCEITLSIRLQNEITFQELQEKLDPFWNNNTRRVEASKSSVRFDSALSGASYKICVSHENESNDYFVVISTFNGFSIGLFGGLKKLNIALNELQRLAGIFDRHGEDTIETQISITPRIKKYFQSQLKGEFASSNFSGHYAAKEVKIINKGFHSIKENISKTIYDWMIRFI